MGASRNFLGVGSDRTCKLTGMGQDGAEGLKVLRSRGWHPIVQDQKSCIVYGMPKAAVQLKATVEVMHPEAIANYLIQQIGIALKKS